MWKVQHQIINQKGIEKCSEDDDEKDKDEDHHLTKITELRLLQTFYYVQY